MLAMRIVVLREGIKVLDIGEDQQLVSQRPPEVMHISLPSPAKRNTSLKRTIIARPRSWSIRQQPFWPWA